MPLSVTAAVLPIEPVVPPLPICKVAADDRGAAAVGVAAGKDLGAGAAEGQVTYSCP